MTIEKACGTPGCPLQEHHTGLCQALVPEGETRGCRRASLEEHISQRVICKPVKTGKRPKFDGNAYYDGDSVFLTVKNHDGSIEEIEGVVVTKKPTKWIGKRPKSRHAKPALVTSESVRVRYLVGIRSCNRQCLRPNCAAPTPDVASAQSSRSLNEIRQSCIDECQDFLWSYVHDEAGAAAFIDQIHATMVLCDIAASSGQMCA